MGKHFHSLKINDLRQETNHAVALNFEVPEDLADTFAFRQGQYLTLRADIDGKSVQRSYSICSGLDDGELRVGIKHVEDGVFSSWANQQLKAGDTIEVMAPRGNFFTELNPGEARNYLCISSGSGITPGSFDHQNAAGARTAEQGHTALRQPAHGDDDVSQRTGFSEEPLYAAIPLD